MITTANPILTALSHELNEASVDTSSKRISYLNSAMKKILQTYKWDWAKLSYDLTITNGVQEYDLTSIPGYSPINGIYEVYDGDNKIYPVNYEDRGAYSSTQMFYLTPDRKTIGFTKEITGDENIKLWYYAQWVDVSSASEEFTIPLPDDLLPAVVKYMKHLVHEAKRQRYDSRNALLDYKQIIDELIPKDYAQKTKDNVKRVKHPFEYFGFRRY